MAGSSGIKAGRAFVEIFADNSPLQRGLKDSAGKLRKFGADVTRIGASMGAVGAAITAPLALSLKGFYDYSNQLGTVSDRVGGTTSAVSALGYAFKQSSLTISDMEGGLMRLQRTVGQAAAGSTQATEALSRLGLSADEMSKMSATDQFKKLADAISGIKNPSEQAAAVMGVMGRRGQMLLPVLTKGSAGIAEMEAEAKRMGLVLGADTTAAFDGLFASTTRLKGSMDGLKNTVGAALAPAVAAIADKITDTIIRVREWVDRNRELVNIIAGVGASLVAAGAAITAIGIGFSVASKYVLVFSKVLSTAVRVALTFKPLLIALAGPWGLLVAGVVAATAAFFKFTKTGQEMWTRITAGVSNMVKVVTGYFKAIGAALAKGDLALAGEVAISGLKLAFLKGLATIKSGFVKLGEIGTEVLSTILLTGNDIWDGMVKGWHTAQKWLKKGFTHVAGFFKKQWAGIKDNAAAAADFVAGSFDSEFDADVAKKARKEKYNANIKKIDEDQATTLGSIDNEYDQDIAARAAAYEKTEANILKLQTSLQAKLRDAQEKSVEEGEKKLKEAQERYAKALRDALEEEAAREEETKVGFGGDREEAREDVKQGAKSVGTFASANLGQIFGTTVDVQEEGNKLLSQIEKGIEKINETLRRDEPGDLTGLVFS